MDPDLHHTETELQHCKASFTAFFINDNFARTFWVSVTNEELAPKVVLVHPAL